MFSQDINKTKYWIKTVVGDFTKLKGAENGLRLDGQRRYPFCPPTRIPRPLDERGPLLMYESFPVGTEQDPLSPLENSRKTSRPRHELSPTALGD